MVCNSLNYCSMEARQVRLNNPMQQPGPASPAKQPGAATRSGKSGKASRCSNPARQVRIVSGMDFVRVLVICSALSRIKDENRQI